MRIELVADVFSEKENLPHVMALLQCLVEGRHEVVLHGRVIELADRYLAAHVPAHAATYGQLLRKGTVATTAWTGVNQARAVTVIRHEDLAEHTHDLCRPAVLVVEDHRSDGCFVRAIARVFDPERVETALDRGWLEIRHGGGSGAVGVAKAEARCFRRLVRVVVVLDSDRLVPGKQTDAHRKVEDLPEAVAIHVLTLREAENYVPNRVIAKIRPHGPTSAKIDLLNELSPLQRGHFDMKKGFGGAAVSDQAELFAALPARVLTGLRKGFGDNLLFLMKQAALSGQLSERDFARLGDDVIRELRVLLATIANVI